MGCQGGRWYNSNQISAKQSSLFKSSITWTTSFGKSGWHIWKGLGGWLHLRQRLQNNHRFLCHNSIVGTWWLRQSCRIWGRQNYLVVFVFVMLITFSWIWMKSDSFVMRSSSRLLGAMIKPTKTKLSEILGFQLHSSGLVVQRVWMVQWYLWQRVQRCTLDLEATTWWPNMYCQNDLVWFKTE